MDQWEQLMNDVREIEHKYDCDLCSQILIELVRIIEYGFMQRQGGSNESSTRV